MDSTDWFSCSIFELIASLLEAPPSSERQLASVDILLHNVNTQCRPNHEPKQTNKQTPHKPKWPLGGPCARLGLRRCLRALRCGLTRTEKEGWSSGGGIQVCGLETGMDCRIECWKRRNVKTAADGLESKKQIQKSKFKRNGNIIHRVVASTNFRTRNAFFSMVSWIRETARVSWRRHPRQSALAFCLNSTTSSPTNNRMSGEHMWKIPGTNQQQTIQANIKNMSAPRLRSNRC